MLFYPYLLDHGKLDLFKKKVQNALKPNSKSKLRNKSSEIQKNAYKTQLENIQNIKPIS